MKQGKCIIATGSSDGDDIMSFAWRTGDVNVLCFLHQWLDYNMLDTRNYMIVYLDNEGAKQKKCPYDYAFHTIDPYWYIITHICFILGTMNVKVECDHAKGHQDDHTTYKELKRPALLIINIDFLAINYRTTKGMKHTKVLQLPINKIDWKAFAMARK
eukprot:5794733-Ditylum_brightwellii.AAC.1